MTMSRSKVGFMGKTTLTQKKRQPQTPSAVRMAGTSEMPNPRR